MLDGASLGRAALVARQRFVQQTAELDPVDLKTLGQFNLLGDPSIHPVESPAATSVPKGVDADRATAWSGAHAAPSCARWASCCRRPSRPHRARPSRFASPPTVQKALANIAREAGIGTRKEFTAFDVKVPPRGASARQQGGADGVPLLCRCIPAQEAGSGQRHRSVAAVAKEVGGRIVGYRIYMEK